MNTDRLFNSGVNFGLNFAVAYGIARLLRDHRAGVRAGVATGSVSAVVSWVLWGRYEAETADAPAATGGSDDPAVPVEEPSAGA